MAGQVRLAHTVPPFTGGDVTRHAGDGIPAEPSEVSDDE
jgi:hypothetical protein